jgi:hypothetical protein
MKKLFIFCSALFLFSFAGQAQQSGLPVNNEISSPENTEDTPLFKSRKKTSFLENPDKVDFGMQIGTSVGSDFRNGGFWSNYAAPSLRYNLHPRWRVSAGTMFVSTQFNAPIAAGSEGTSMGRVNSFQTFVYTQGQYMASDRLRLTGSFFYEVNQFNGGVPENESASR